MHFLIIGPLLHIIDLIHAIEQMVIETLGPLTIQWLMRSARGRSLWKSVTAMNVQRLLRRKGP